MSPIINMSNNKVQVNKGNKQLQNKNNVPKCKESYNSYSKAKGTTEDSGTLYETKLLSLILIRALHDNNIQQFNLASNIAGKTGFDDIVLRYKNCNSPKSRLFFLQAKHRENHNITIEDFTNPKNEFCLRDYLPSYLNLRRLFLTTNNKRIFAGTSKDVDYVFIIFTSAKAYFTDKAQHKHALFFSELSSEEYPPDDYFVHTDKNGKIFQISNKKVITINKTHIRQNEKKILEYEKELNYNAKAIIKNKKSSNIYKDFVEENTESTNNPADLSVISILRIFFYKIFIYVMSYVCSENDSFKLDANRILLQENWKFIQENEKLLNKNEELLKYNEDLTQDKGKLDNAEKIINKNSKTINENMKIIHINVKLLNKNENSIHNRKNANENENLLVVDENVSIEYDKLMDHNDKLLNKNEQLVKENNEMINETEKLINKNETIVEDLVASIVDSRTDDLASSLSQYILNGKPKSWPLKQIFKEYQMFLSQNVIEIVLELEQHYECKFKLSFLNSNEISLKIFRQEICKKLNLFGDEENSVNKLQSLRFKLPVNFNKPSFLIGTQSKDANVQDVYNVFIKLFQSEILCKRSKYNYIKIDDQSVADKIVLKADLTVLGKLVGTLLINDDETDMMKFNFDPENTDEDNFMTLTKLMVIYDEIHLRAFRFDIQYYEFPKFKLNSLCCVEHDRKLVKDFLSNLYIYTDQGKQSDVEVIIKQIIDKLLSNEQIHESIYSDKRDSIFIHFHGLVHAWWKDFGEVLCLNESCDYYKKAMRIILHSRLVNAHFDYTSQISKNLLLRFRREVINHLNLQLNYSKTKIIISDNTYFTSVKIYQYFHEILNDTKYYFVTVETLENSFESVIKELESTVIQTLVLIFSSCNNSSKTIDIMKSVFDVFKGEKMIIIAHGNLEHFLKLICPEIVPYKDVYNNFNNLLEEIQSIILEKRLIEFQGIVVPVKVVFNEASLDLLSSRQLHIIIDNKEILKIGETFKDEDYQKIIALDNYQSLSLHRHIVLNTTKIKDSDLRVINDNMNQELSAINNSDIVLINDSEKIFKDICERNPQTNTHWFSKDERNEVVWKMSNGNIDSIIKYISRITSHNNSIQIKSLEDLDARVVIVSADPGMGKSTLLSHLAQNTTGLWLEKINLYDMIQSEMWNDTNAEINLLDALKFIYAKISNRNFNSNHNFKEFMKELSIQNGNEIVFNEINSSCHSDWSEHKLFTYFYNNGKVALLFDGYDEICSNYAVQVTRLLCILKTSKICNLWITSRPYNALVQLECDLGTFSFGINPLSLSQQRSYLMKMWSKYWPVSDDDSEVDSTSYRVNIEGTIEKRSISQQQVRELIINTRNIKIELMADIFISVINFVIGDRKQVFTANPQNLFIIADIYDTFITDYYYSYTQNKEQFKKDLEKTANLTTFFEKFMRKKFYDIKYGQKIPKSIRQQLINVLKMDNFINDEYDSFLQRHKLLAVYLLLDKNLLITAEHEILNNFIKKLKSDFKNTGLINIIEGNPTFVHFSYAEYFVVEFIFERLIHGCSDMWKYFIEQLLTNNDTGVQRFINSKLQKIHNNVVNLLITRNELHIKQILNAVMSQNYSLRNTAFLVAIEDDFEHIALFLLECFRLIVNEENVTDFIHFINKTYGKYCIFCAAIANGKPSIVNRLLELITQINSDKIRNLFYCQDIKKFNPLLLSLCTKEMATLILEWLKQTPDLMVDLFILNHEHGKVPTIAHFVGQRGFILKYCWRFLKMLNKEQLNRIFILNIDKNGQIPAHYAAEDNNSEFFNEMKILLGETEYEIICETSDNDGNTPRSILSSVSENHINAIIMEGIDSEEMDVMMNNIPQSVSMLDHMFSVSMNAVYECGDQYGHWLLHHLIHND